MASRNLVRHWLGISKEDITKNWEQDRRDQYDEIMANERMRVETAITDGIQTRAENGELDAVEWLEKRGFLDGDERLRRRIVIRIYDAIAKRAEKGELDAVVWLEDRGLIQLPGIPDATD